MDIYSQNEFAGLWRDRAMRRIRPALFWVLLASLVVLLPLAVALADTAMDTDLVLNGGAELSGLTNWDPFTSEGRWNSSEYYDSWPPAAVGNKYFFIYNPSLDRNVEDTLSQVITLSGTEGSGLFANISAGTVSLRFNAYMYQALAGGSEAKAVIEQYSASGTLLKTSQVVNTNIGTGALASYELNTQLETATRSLKVNLVVSLVKPCYAQFDSISLKLVSAAAGSPPAFGSDFPTSAATDSGVTYTAPFTISDPDAGDVDALTFSAASTNADLIPAANVTVGGSGGNRTVTVVPTAGLSGEADITITASDSTHSTDKTFHIVIAKVISMDSNLVENGSATSGLASWSGNTVNVRATASGFKLSSPGAYIDTEAGYLQVCDVDQRR